MTYRVSCPVCPFHDELEELDAVLELQEEHRAECGDLHILEYVLIR